MHAEARLAKGLADIGAAGETSTEAVEALEIRPVPVGVLLPELIGEVALGLVVEVMDARETRELKLPREPDSPFPCSCIALNVLYAA